MEMKNKSQVEEEKNNDMQTKLHLLYLFYFSDMCRKWVIILKIPTCVMRFML